MISLHQRMAGLAMRYYIKRNEQEYGPYSEEDLRRYVSEGSIVMTDIARPENSTSTLPVSEILNPPTPTPSAPTPPQMPAYGTPQQPQQTPVSGTPTPQPQPQQQHWGTPGVGQPQQHWGATPAGQPGTGPVPPDLHWALVLVISFFCGIFSIVWVFIQASFVRKLDPNSKGIMLIIVSFALAVVAVVCMLAAQEVEALAFAGILMYLGAVVCAIAAWFNMKDSLERYYNSVEPYGLRLSGVMTFFFNLYYFQYHFSKIAHWKKTGVRL